jgi:hypothetical protein
MPARSMFVTANPFISGLTANACRYRSTPEMKGGDLKPEIIVTRVLQPVNKKVEMLYLSFLDRWLQRIQNRYLRHERTPKM